MSLVFRTLEVPDAHVALARQLAETLAGPAGSGMWSVPLSPTGADPATHFESTGYIEDSFADLLPFAEWEQNEDGTWVELERFPGLPEVIVDLAAGEGLEVSLEDVTALLDSCDVTAQEWPVVRQRMGLQAVQPQEPV